MSPGVPLSACLGLGLRIPATVPTPEPLPHSFLTRQVLGTEFRSLCPATQSRKFIGPAIFPTLLLASAFLLSRRSHAYRRRSLHLGHHVGDNVCRQTLGQLPWGQYKWVDALVARGNKPLVVFWLARTLHWLSGKQATGSESVGRKDEPRTLEGNPSWHQQRLCSEKCRCLELTVQS